MTDNTNRGALFNAKPNIKVIKQGKIDVEGMEKQMIITQTNVNGSTYFDLYEKVGGIFQNDKKTSENSPDIYGFLNAPNKEFKVAGWSSTSKAGNKYTSISLQEKEAEQGSKPDDEQYVDVENADDIPF